MKIHRLYALSLFAVLIVFGLTDPCFAFRCGTELVDEGDSKKEKVKIEEWTYNPGPTEFIRYLRFENGILTNISTGDKGF
jgi:hypothetical protein